ncbi:hypothetical protein KIPB_002543 [Kipferlia bialata]|uniref:Uncharacterized protein n=1 Tax=Kipferlia bialata TaxID=797122 RepID=A0A9K3GGR3_9EUKA|nr:hypothetical protein KIPB_002543 [Kipferlia bialata]|eukprot:g2543.t1
METDPDAPDAESDGVDCVGCDDMSVTETDSIDSALMDSDTEADAEGEVVGEVVSVTPLPTSAVPTPNPAAAAGEGKGVSLDHDSTWPDTGDTDTESVGGEYHVHSDSDMSDEEENHFSQVDHYLFLLYTLGLTTCSRLVERWEAAHPEFVPEEEDELD